MQVAYEGFRNSSFTYTSLLYSEDPEPDHYACAPLDAEDGVILVHPSATHNKALDCKRVIKIAMPLMKILLNKIPFSEVENRDSRCGAVAPEDSLKHQSTLKWQSILFEALIIEENLQEIHRRCH